MALATQCPFCQTTFRVAQDQLKLRGGLVRCGHCKEVFNGNEHLVTQEVAQQLVATLPAQTSATPTPSSWPQLPVLPNPADTTPASDDISAAPAAAPEMPGTPAWPAPANLSAAFASIAAATSDAPWGTSTEPAPGAATPATGGGTNEAAATPGATEAATINTLTQELSFPVPQTSSAPQPDVNTSNDSAAETAAIDKALNELAAETTAQAPPGLLKQATREDQQQFVSDEALEHPGQAAGQEPLDQAVEQVSDSNSNSNPNSDSDENEDDQEPLEDDTPGFVQRAERRERLGRVIRVLMLVGVILLGIALPLQALYLWRNQVAALLPSTRPLLSAVCAKLHCTVGLPANIEQLSLESNELQLLPPSQNTYTLTVLLRNRGAATQAWPYMELTLNDNDEKAITRRVFTPREYLATVQHVNDGFAGNSEQQVKLTFTLSQPVAAGYRVYLFYP